MLQDANRLYFTDDPIIPESVDLDREGITVFDGLVYSETEDGILRMDLMTDESVKGKKSVIIWVHGGGFTEERITRKSRPEKRFLALLRKGYMVASIDYRLSQVRPFPSQICDCKCAVRYLRANAERFGIDPGKIGVWGESCGGQLAALMSVRGGIPAFEGVGGYEGVSSEIQAAVSWYGALDVMEFHNTRMACDEAYPARFEIMYGKKPEEAMDLLRSSNPLSYVGQGTCPILAMCSDGDNRVSYTVNLAFCDRVNAGGGVAEFIKVSGQGHGYFTGDEYDRIVYDFFDKYLRA